MVFKLDLKNIEGRWRWLFVFISGAMLPAAPAEDVARRIEEVRTGSFELLVQGPQGKPLSETEVEIELARHEFLFGGNIYAFDRFGSPFQNQAYKRSFEEIFNYATLPFYWKTYEPRRGEPGHWRTERIAAWCNAKGILAKGHPLVWTNPAGVPDWIKLLSPAEVSSLILSRVRDSVKKFRGKISSWDVINEPIHTPPFAGFPDRVAQVLDAYRAAREEDPSAKLVLNEYHVMSERAKNFYPFVERCLEAGAPIDAVGIQAHEPRFARFDPERMDVVLDQFARLGKEIHLTEIVFTSGGQKVLRRRPDGSFGETETTWTEESQAEVVEEFYRRAFSHPAVTAITWWDLADGRSWLPGGGLLRKDLTPKPAYQVLKRMIRDEWWTRKKLRTDSSGRVSFRGFFGTYRIRAKVGEEILEQTIPFKKASPRQAAVDLPLPWKVEPGKPRGVFLDSDPVKFILAGRRQSPLLKVLDVDGRDVGKANITAEQVAPERFQVMVAGLGTGYYRLVLSASNGREETRHSFAVLPELSSKPGPDSSIAADAAISWLVARPGAPRSRVNDTLRLAHRAGLRFLRERISWGEVERRPGEYRWGRYDVVASAAQEAGLEVYQILHASPPWSRSDRRAKRMPDDLRHAYRFARAAGEHFRGRVVAWETWNEPDISVFSDDTADQLAAFQKAMYLGFKAADPELTVLMVSLAHPPGPFMECFLENETAPYFEVYNYHTYESLDGYERRAAAHAEVRRRFGISEKPVWVTEAGVALRAPTGKLTPEDAVRQAEFLPKAYVLSLAYGTSRHFFFIFPPYLENDVQFGILEEDLEPSPAYVALHALISALGNAKRPRLLEGLPEGLEGWLFSRGDGLEAAAVWAKEEASLSMKDGLEARELYGRPLQPQSDGKLHITNNVTYLIGKAEAFGAWKPREPAPPSAASPAPFSLPGIVLRFVFPTDRTDKKREAWKVGEGAVLEGNLQVYNFSRDEFRGTIRITGSPGLAVEPPEKQVLIAPDGLESLDIRIRWEGEGAPLRSVRAVAVPQGSSGKDGARSSAAVARVVK